MHSKKNRLKTSDLFLVLYNISAKLSPLPQKRPFHRQNLYVFSCYEHFESCFCDVRRYRCVLPEIRPFQNAFTPN